MDLTTAIAIYNFIGLGLTGLAMFWFAKHPSWWRSFVSGAGLLVTFLILALIQSPDNPLRTANLLCYGWFVHFPLLLLGICWMCRGSHRVLSRLCLLGIVLLVVITVYAFRIEPFRLEITRTRLITDKLQRPIRIALVADFQTDEFKEYQRASLRTLMNEKPDMIVMAGDYLQANSQPEWERLRNEMNAFLKEIDFSAPDGIYAVGGNTDFQRWPEIFAGLPVETIQQTTTIEREDFFLTGFEWLTSFQVTNCIAPTSKFHIVVGHAPDFALGDVAGDLLLAGHTHGGQVRIPFYGPLITFSEVPRRWAAGVTQIDQHRTLAVARGVGMERRDAPRLRFLCRPEIIVIDVIPREPAAP